MKWGKVSVTIPGISQIIDGVGYVKDGIGYYNDGMEIARAVLEFSAAMRAFGDPTSASINAAIDAAQRVFADWADPVAQASGYILDIPLVNPKKERPSPPEIPMNALEHLMVAANVRYPGVDTVGTGGNYGLYRLTVESLYDEKDPSRPILTEDLTVGALIVVYGAKTYLPALNLALNLCELFEGLFSLPPGAGQSPVPQNVKVKPIAAQSLPRDPDRRIVEVGESRDGEIFAARITWDRAPVYRRAPGTSILYGIYSWHVYIKEGGPIEPGEDLDTYEVISKRIPGMRVPATDVYLQGTYTDAIITGLHPDKTYYASVAYTLVMVDESVEDKMLAERLRYPSMSGLSEQVRIRLREQVPADKFVSGTPPDWVGIRSPIAVVPSLKSHFDRLNGLVDAVQNNLTGYVNELSAAAKSAEKRAADIFKALDTVIAAVERIARQIESLANDNSKEAGIWATSFKSEGGKAAFVKKLGEAFLDSDPENDNAPPFTTGNEPAGAFVFVVEGQTPGDVDALLGPLKLLFANDDAGDSSTAKTIRGLGGALAPQNDDSDARVKPQGVSLHDLGLDDDPC